MYDNINPPEEVVAWMRDILEDEGYTVVPRERVRHYAIQNDLSTLTIVTAKDFDIMGALKRDMANQIALKLVETIHFDEKITGDTVRLSTEVKFIV